MLYATIGGYVEFDRFLDMSRYYQEGYEDYVEDFQDFDGVGGFVHPNVLYQTWFGYILFLLPFIADTVLLIGLICALVSWHKWHRTSKVFKYSWLVSTVIPLIPAFVPFGFIISSTFKDDFLQKCNEKETVHVNQDQRNTSNQNGLHTHCEMALQEVLLVSQLSAAFNYGIMILPLVLTFPSSCVRAALRVRGLVPDSSFSSWMISIAAPFHSMMILVSLIFLIQTAENVVLVSAALLMCLAPWLYVIRRNSYVSITNDEKEKQIDTNQNLMFCMWIVAVGLIVVWANTATIFGRPLIGAREPEPLYYVYVYDNSTGAYVYDHVYDADADDDDEQKREPWMTYNYFYQLMFESFGRLLVTTANTATIFGRPLIGAHEPEPVFVYVYDPFLGAYVPHVYDADNELQEYDADGDDEQKREPWMTYNYFFQLMFESFGRLLVTTVVFGDAILCMTVENFQHNLSRIVDVSTWERIKNIFESLESGIH
eukprot:CAMPEP_0201739286 /NCGR_PEP_ID=MMETSP0593-20130828/45701_1 /ASSEMBLY_ACC=CAM_ASM_000672 /TAXON_ID=267983 /ORGANISM="Skeletonema japonicum, Strain CCMP2506" /LENGTH=483 /DNA_ID=CAMNT_0048233549 /DNA_START=172 /DNA_END=1623 /DNA_ORIENTATION=+